MELNRTELLTLHTYRILSRNFSFTFSPHVSFTCPAVMKPRSMPTSFICATFWCGVCHTVVVITGLPLYHFIVLRPWRTFTVFTGRNISHRPIQHHFSKQKTIRNYKNFWLHDEKICIMLGCRRDVPENCAPLGYYAVSSGNFLPTFRDNLSVRSPGFKKK
jgi:hypothetical protein